MNAKSPATGSWEMLLIWLYSYQSFVIVKWFIEMADRGIKLQCLWARTLSFACKRDVVDTAIAIYWHYRPFVMLSFLAFNGRTNEHQQHQKRLARTKDRPNDAQLRSHYEVFTTWPHTDRSEWNAHRESKRPSNTVTQNATQFTQCWMAAIKRWLKR